MNVFDFQILKADFADRKEKQAARNELSRQLKIRKKDLRDQVEGFHDDKRKMVLALSILSVPTLAFIVLSAASFKYSYGIIVILPSLIFLLFNGFLVVVGIITMNSAWRRIVRACRSLESDMSRFYDKEFDLSYILRRKIRTKNTQGDSQRSSEA